MKRPIKYRNNLSESAFTLIELLIVILIIGILSIISVATFSEARAKSRDVRRIQDIKAIQQALVMYLDNEDTYPVIEAAAPGIAITGNDAVSLVLKSAGILLNSAVDPLFGQDRGFIFPMNYYYRTDVQGNSYILTFCLETNSVPGYFQGCLNSVSY